MPLRSAAPALSPSGVSEGLSRRRQSRSSARCGRRGALPNFRVKWFPELFVDDYTTSIFQGSPLHFTPTDV